MLEQLIPDAEVELENLAHIGTTGFVMGFGLRFGQPDFFLNRYPDAWTEKYEEENYFFGDPVAAWTIARTGTIRWSDIGFPDPRGVGKEAAKHGLIYGATTVTKVGRKRCFLSLARPDRELADAELDHIERSLKRWAKIVCKSPQALTEAELDVLRLSRDGLINVDIAEKLDISPSTVKFRMNSVQKKLGVDNRIAAITMAVRKQLI